MRPQRNRLRPLEPIFNYEPRRGAIDAGRTPGFPFPVSYVGAGDASVATNGSLGVVVDLPDDTQSGDWAVVVAVAASTNDLVMTATGWSQRYSMDAASGGTDYDQIHVWTKFVSGPSDNPEFEITLTQPILARSMVFRNVRNPLVIEDSETEFVAANDDESPANGMNFGTKTVTTRGALMVLAGACRPQTNSLRRFNPFPATTDWVEAFNTQVGPNSSWYSNVIGAYAMASAVGARPTPNWLMYDGLAPYTTRGGVVMVLSPGP